MKTGLKKKSFQVRIKSFEGSFFLERESMYVLRLDHELTRDIFDGAEKDVRDWAVNAIANIVVADDVVEKHEFAALQEAISLLDNREEVHDLMQRVKDRNLFPVDRISMPTSISSKVFFYLASMAVIDGNLKKSEAELLKKCGNFLGLNDEYIRVVMKWAVSQMEINRRWTKEQKRSNLERKRIIAAINA